MSQSAMMCDVAEQTFGQRVAARREELELSQRRAAHLAGIGETTWRNIERGRELRRGVNRDSPKPPQRITVRRIAKLLGWPVADAMRWAGYDDPGLEDETDDAECDVCERAREQLDELLLRMTDVQVRSLAAMIESFFGADTGGEGTDIAAVPRKRGVNVQYLTERDRDALDPDAPGEQAPARRNGDD